MNRIKILGINTSARGRDSSTYYLMKAAFDEIQDEDIEKNIIVASELNLKPCKHYYSSNSKMCVYPCLITQLDKDDEMVKICEGILEADIVIFSTPIHWGNHSQLMQLIVERLNALENANSVHGKVLVKNKIASLMIVGHEDGYQHVSGQLMNFLTCLGMIFPPYAYAAWVGESNENTLGDKEKIESAKVKNIFIDSLRNTVDFSKRLLFCPNCGNKFDYEHISKIKSNY